MKKFIVFLVLIMATISQAQIIVESGATSVITYFVMRDRTTSVRDTGVTIANLEMYYVIDQTAESADAFTGELTAATTAWTDGECKNIGHGVYRVDWPNAAFAGAAGTRVQLTLVDGDAGAFTETLEALLSPPVNANLVSILGTAITETAGQIAAAFSKWFNIATPQKTMNQVGGRYK